MATNVCRHKEGEQNISSSSIIQVQHQYLDWLTICLVKFTFFYDFFDVSSFAFLHAHMLIFLLRKLMFGSQSRWAYFFINNVRLQIKRLHWNLHQYVFDSFTNASITATTAMTHTHKVGNKFIMSLTTMERVLYIFLFLFPFRSATTLSKYWNHRLLIKCGKMNVSSCI